MTRTTYMTTRIRITDNINPSQIRCSNLKYCKGILVLAASVLKRNVNIMSYRRNANSGGAKQMHLDFK
jgi:hypothetical protein